MLDIIINNTKKYIDTHDKVNRKNKGQFFTPVSIAEFMAVRASGVAEHLSILEPGACLLYTSPPYGERLEEKANIPPLYRKLGERFKALDTWSLYLITSYEDAQKDIGRKADKNRKIYNGMMKTYYYQFQGPKPPRKA